MGGLVLCSDVHGVLALCTLVHGTEGEREHGGSGESEGETKRELGRVESRWSAQLTHGCHALGTRRPVGHYSTP